MKFGQLDLKGGEFDHKACFLLVDRGKCTFGGISFLVTYWYWLAAGLASNKSKEAASREKLFRCNRSSITVAKVQKYAM